MERTDDDLITAKVLAKYLDVKDRTLREMVRAGECPAPIRFGSMARWRWGTIRRWIEAVETVQRLSPGLAKSGMARHGTVEERQSAADAGKPPSGPSKPR